MRAIIHPSVQSIIWCVCIVYPQIIIIHKKEPSQADLIWWGNIHYDTASYNTIRIRIPINHNQFVALCLFIRSQILHFNPLPQCVSLIRFLNSPSSTSFPSLTEIIHKKRPKNLPQNQKMLKRAKIKIPEKVLCTPAPAPAYDENAQENKYLYVKKRRKGKKDQGLKTMYAAVLI